MPRDRHIKIFILNFLKILSAKRSLLIQDQILLRRFINIISRKSKNLKKSKNSMSEWAKKIFQAGLEPRPITLQVRVVNHYTTDAINKSRIDQPFDRMSDSSKSSKTLRHGSDIVFSKTFFDRKIAFLMNNLPSSVRSCTNFLTRVLSILIAFFIDFETKSHILDAQKHK